MRKESKLLNGKMYREDFSLFNEYILEVERKCEIPEKYELVEVQDDIQQNEHNVIRLRYAEKGTQNKLYGPHYSIVIRKNDHVILGFVNLTREMVVKHGEALPSHEETKILAKTFFDQYEPGYFENLENLWIDRHEETIEVNGVDEIVAGTKYKCLIKNEGNYAWVVFGKDKQPIIFERNINWVSGRTTEKWLHDSYLESGTLDLHPVRTEQ